MGWMGGGEWDQYSWSCCSCVGMTPLASSFPLQLGMEQVGINGINWLCLLLNWLLSTSPKKVVSVHSWQNSHIPVDARCEQTVALAAKPSGTSGLMSRALYSKAPGASHVFISTHSRVEIVAVLVGNGWLGMHLIKTGSVFFSEYP